MHQLRILDMQAGNEKLDQTLQTLDNINPKPAYLMAVWISDHQAPMYGSYCHLADDCSGNHNGMGMSIVSSNVFESFNSQVIT